MPLMLHTYIHTYIHTYTFDINIITSALKSVPGDSLAVPTTNTPGNNSKDYLKIEFMRQKVKMVCMYKCVYIHLRSC